MNCSVEKAGLCRGSDDKRPSCVELPDDLVIDILHRLPQKSLFRFIYVAKSWSRMIKDPSFVENYRGRRETVLLMARSLPPSEPSSHHNNGAMLLSFHDVDVPEIEVWPSLSIKYLNDLLRLEGDCQSFSLVGSYNGIVCIKYGREYILCNPALHEFKRLPSLLKPRDYVIPVVTGFGVTGKDFKIIVIHIDRENGYNLAYHVYRSSTNSWRQVHDATVSPSLIYSRSENVFVNGSCHWNLLSFSDRTVITCFDIKSEVFRKLELPAYLRFTHDHLVSLTVLDGCLGFSDVADDMLQLWVMKSYGVKETWTKIFTKSCQPGHPRSFLPWKNDLFGILHGPGGYEGESRQLTSTALHTGTMRSFQVYADARMYIYMMIHEESLVSLD